MSRQIRLLVVAQDINHFINTLLTKNTIVITYDFYNPSQNLSLLASNICKSIPAKTTVQSIGFMYHSNPLHLQLFECDVSRKTIYNTTDDYKDINLFLSMLYLVAKTTQFDFITCSLVPHGNNALSIIANELSNIHNTNIIINASVDTTGINGNWVLEQGQFNLIDTYFNSRISKTNINLKKTIILPDINKRNIILQYLREIDNPTDAWIKNTTILQILIVDQDINKFNEWKDTLSNYIKWVMYHSFRIKDNWPPVSALFYKNIKSAADKFSKADKRPESEIRRELVMQYVIKYYPKGPDSLPTRII